MFETMTLRILFWERVVCGAQSVGMDICLCVIPGLATDCETWSRHLTSHSKHHLGLAMERMFQIEISNTSQFITLKHMFAVSYISV